MKMKLIQYNHVFSLTKSPLEYIDISAFGDKSYFTTMLYLNSGSKWLAPVVTNLLIVDEIIDGLPAYTITNENLQLLGTVITAKFNDSWNKINNTLVIEYNPISDYRMAGTETISGTASIASADNNNVISKVTSYDTEEDSYVDSTKDIANKTFNQSNQNSNNSAFQKEGITGKKPVQSYINHEIELRKTTIRDIIIKDLISFLTLALY